MKRVVIGMSGGVDSSVAAYVLQKQGYDVVGVFMNNWEETDEDGACTAQEDYADAKSVCLKLNIPFYSVNFAKEYWDRVFTYFLEEYKKGRTPNPDVLCNSEIKFRSFLDYAMQNLDADYIATGHYVRNVVKDGEVKLLRGVDPKKDQSYFLSFLSKEQISKALFPIGDIEKSEVRRIATELNLRTATKKDSMGICFIGERNFTKFLSSYLPAQKGDMVDMDTMQKVSEHMGLMYYTIGQRRGLGIGNKGAGERWYVCDKDIEKNILYVVEGGDNPKLFHRGFTSTVSSFVNPILDGKRHLLIKYRHQQMQKGATLIKEGEHITVLFDEVQSGLTPGQFGVFYDGEECLGGAIIDEIIKE